MAEIQFGDELENVITREEWPLSKARETLKDETIAVLGYGVQGPGQALNLRDNGFNVIIGQAKSFRKDWDRARKDGWVPGKTLFDHSVDGIAPASANAHNFNPCKRFHGG